MAMRGLLGMVTGVGGGAALALALAGGCSSSGGAAPDGGSEGGGIRRLDSGGGGTDAEEDAAPYTGPALTSCTQSSISAPFENADGGGVDAGDVRDGSADASAMGDAGAPVAGTTGMTCTSDATCKGNVCDLNDPTPVCVVPANPADPRGANCDPGTDGTLHFCDGSSSANPVAICLPLDNPPVTGQGLCLQGCTYLTDGSPAAGCTGNDACIPTMEYLQASTGNGVVGLGICGGGCMSDLDCLGPYSKCQVEFGLCTNSEAAVNATACNCSFDPTTGTSGFCAQECVVGSPTKCPSGTICDAQEPTSLVNNATSALVPGFTEQNPGLAGFCFPTCTGNCPSNATCSDGYAAGMDCQP